MQQTNSSGIVPRLWARLFGEQASRLSERLQPSHWLSYVLILSQSAAVLLVFGHAELPLLASPSWAIRSIAAMGLFVLVATVFAADMALLATLRRIPILARNRQRWALREHMAYTLFVLVTEAVTLGVVLSTLDADPLALISARPLIPPQGFAFHAQIVLRVCLISWSAIQLVIVRGKLPVLLSTLTSTGRELVGAHVEGRLAALDIRDISLPAAFRTYAAMSKPPRRIRTAFNGWLVRRELAQEAEEERQVQNVVSALEDLERRQRSEREDVPAIAPAEDAAEDFRPDRPPTGGGTPVAAPRKTSRQIRTPRRVLELPEPERRRTAARANARGSNRRSVRTASVEAKARAAWQPGMSVSQLERSAGISRNSAAKWARVLEAEAGQVAQ